MGHAFYHIAYSYYQDRFVRGNGHPVRRVGQADTGGTALRAAAENADRGEFRLEPEGACHAVLRVAAIEQAQRNGAAIGGRLPRAVLRPARTAHGPAADGRPPHVPHRLPHQPYAGLQFPRAFCRVCTAGQADGKPADGRLAGPGGPEHGALPGGVQHAAQGRAVPQGDRRPLPRGGPSPPRQRPQGLDHRYLRRGQRREPHHPGPGPNRPQDRAETGRPHQHGAAPETENLPRTGSGPPATEHRPRVLGRVPRSI